MTTVLRLLLCGAAAAPAAALGGLSFDGVNQYVTFGRATNLGSPTFTLETWFNWKGRGVAATTGSGGVSAAIPLIAKLSPEKDGDNRDGNYYLGLRASDGVLVADLEEGGIGATPGRNHPVIGVTPVKTNVWHHAALTYDGSNWVLYLDGRPETNLFVGQPPRWDSIQHAALGSSLNSTGAPLGYFAGAMAEVRIWNYARSASDIASNRNVQISAAPGLLGRWALDETSGAVARDSSGHGVDGKLVHGPVWTSGERAAEDVVAPIKLVVIDPERTAALRQTEGRRLPPIFRYDPAVAAQADKSFRAGFLITREKFLAELEEVFPRPRGGAQVFANPRFGQWLAEFQSSNKGFPVSTQLAQTWVSAQSDEVLQADCATKLREVMDRRIRPDLQPAEARAGSPNVLLLSLGFSNAAPALDAMEKQSVSCFRTNLWTLTKARGELLKLYPTNEQSVARYLAGFVQENCRFDANLTRESRARQTEALFTGDHYEPGQVIVKRGQIIEARIKAALDEMVARTAGGELKAQMIAEQIRAQAAAERTKAETALKELQQQAAFAEFKSKLFSQQNRWLLGGLVLVAVASSLAVWRLARPKRLQTLLPVPIPRDVPALPPVTADEIPARPDGSAPEGWDEEAWKERALAAEQRAAQASAAVRAGLLPHLAQWLKHKLVRRLVADRSQFVNVQQKAERELVELEKRLAQLQAPLEERLRAYAQRIAELERELAAQGAENRELIQAKIKLTREKMALEQGRSQATWN